MADPFWKTFHDAPDCPSDPYPGSHPKCCDGCPYPETPCAKPLDCGEKCFLPAGHDGPCLCIGDENGEPESCPA